MDDQHFKEFKRSLERAIGQIEHLDRRSFVIRQRRYFNLLVRLEKQFRTHLAETPRGRAAYEAFVRYICDRESGKKGGILDARPYFRVRQGRFARQVSKAFRDRNVDALMRHPINFRFVNFVVGLGWWGPKSQVFQTAAGISEVRNKLVTMNLPLAISQARIFYGRTPRSHLSYMDEVQIATEGLLSGIDKFVPPFNKVFMGVAIGRMRGNLIESYSDTYIHFYPDDKRRLYRANKAVGRGEQDIEAITRSVNQGVESGQETTSAQVANLMAASSTVSIDAKPRGEDDSRVGVQMQMSDRMAAPASCQPDVIVEQLDGERALREAYGVLSLFERKILAALGVDVEER